MNRKLFYRKAHRLLGLVIGVQLFFWTLSGMYFSWTNLDRIHGDHYKILDAESAYNKDLFPLGDLDLPDGIQQIEMREINGEPFYWINGSSLFNARSGKLKEGITEEEALAVAKAHVQTAYEAASVELITNTDKHHEYRGRPLPAYVIHYNETRKLKSYVSKDDGKFQTVRHNGWRVFDFLWMMHTMDYKGRDNFNNFVLRGFSVLGLFTVLSGFFLGIISKRKRKR